MNRKGTLEIVSHKQQHAGNGGGSFTVRCDCGNEFTCFASRWQGFTGRGCGKCFKSRQFSGANNPKYKHGGYLDKKYEYTSWYAMHHRCSNPNYRAYHRYGGRGIRVCDRWSGEDGFVNFFSDMGRKPTRKHTIDRIDNDSDYSPENCKWSTMTTQANNTARNRFINVGGVDDTVANHCRTYGIPRNMYENRRKLGWDTEKIFNTKSLGIGANQVSYK